MTRHFGHKKGFFYYLHRCERHLNIQICFSLLLVFGLVGVLFLYDGVRGSVTANFTMSILPQPLAVNIVDENYNPIEEPEVQFTQQTYTPECREILAQLASEEQQVYIRNFDAADNGWTVTISADSPTVAWSSADGDYHFDFNDPTGDGCVDGGDPDTLAGSMEIYTQNDSLESGSCPLCSENFLNSVPVGVFDEEGGINTVALVYATSNSDNRGDWRLSDIIVRQTVPASQPAAGEYDIPLLLSITAN